MWQTIFVHKGKELRFNRELPPLAEEGHILLYFTDAFDGTKVPKKYYIRQVIFDVHSELPKQYVHVDELMECIDA